MDDPLNRGEADAVSREFFFSMQALKGRKELIRALHIEASAVVPNEICSVTSLRGGAELDYGVFGFSSIFPSIG